MPISFVELMPNNLLNKNTNCKTIQPAAYSTLPSTMNSMVYQPITNNNNVNNRQQPSQFTITNALQQAQSIIGVQIPLPQKYFQNFTLCKALYDFQSPNLNDKNCLNFKKNDLITLIRRVDENWLEGSLNDHIGIFPITFVEFLPTIRPTTRSSSQQSSSSLKQQTTGLPTPPIYNRAQNSNQPANNSTTNNRNTINISQSHSRSNSINTQLPNDVMHIRSNSISNNITAHRCNNNTGIEFNTNPKMTNLPTQQQQQFSTNFGNLEDNSNLINLSGSSSSNSYDNLLDIRSTNDQNKSNQNL